MTQGSEGGGLFWLGGKVLDGTGTRCCTKTKEEALTNSRKSIHPSPQLYFTSATKRLEAGLRGRSISSQNLKSEFELFMRFILVASCSESSRLKNGAVSFGRPRDFWGIAMLTVSPS